MLTVNLRNDLACLRGTREGVPRSKTIFHAAFLRGTLGPLSTITGEDRFLRLLQGRLTRACPLRRISLLATACGLLRLGRGRMAVANGKHHLPPRHIRIHNHMIAMQHFAFQDFERQRVLAVMCCARRPRLNSLRDGLLHPVRFDGLHASR